MLLIPLLRRGRPYRSLDVVRVPHHATGAPFVEVSQANTGLIRRDLAQQADMRAALTALTTNRLIGITRDAAAIYLNDTLPVGDSPQTPDDYVAQVSATTGMPLAMVRRHLTRVASVMTNVEPIVRGLTRGLAPGLLDAGCGEMDGHIVSVVPRAQSLGVVLPSNSPGVHGLWVPAMVLKMPLVLKPGSAEPWTPYRIIQAFLHAGAPPDAFNYFPTSHAGAGEIVRQCGRSMFFGDASTVGAFRNDPRIELHGPGFSKVLLGDDSADRWQEYLDLIVASVGENGGRSCINASGVWTPRHGTDIADALAERLAAIEPRDASDPRAELAPFPDRRTAEAISAQIDLGLHEPGAVDVSARHRSGSRVVQHDGATYVRPTVIHCSSPSHPLANREFLFPFVSVVDVSPDDMASMPDPLGPTLVVTALTHDQKLADRLLASPLIGRLNLGPIQTNAIVWDQPHEGNLFDHLYGRRAFQTHESTSGVVFS